MAFSSELKARYTLLPATYGGDEPSKESTSTAKAILPPIPPITATLFSILLLSCTVLMITALCIGPRAPVVRLNSLSVTNFTVSNTKLAANWVADFTVYNPSLATKLSLDHIESAVFYREINNAIAITSSVEGFDVESRGENGVRVKFSTTGYEGDQPIVEYPVLREIEEDKRTGTVRFSMRMNMRTTYESAAGYHYWLAWTSRNFVMNSYCLDLKVGVVAGDDDGSLIGFGGGSRQCVVVMMVDHDSWS